MSILEKMLKRCGEKRCNKVFNVLVDWELYHCEDESKQICNQLV